MAVSAPNYTQIPNAILHAMPEMKEAELRLILAICRQTFGYHKEGDRISLSQLQKMTGMSRQAVCDARQQPFASRLVRRERSGNGFVYSIEVVNDVDHPLVNEVDQGSQRGRPQVVNDVDPQKKDSKEKEPKESNNDGRAGARGDGQSQSAAQYEVQVGGRPSTAATTGAKTRSPRSARWSFVPERHRDVLADIKQAAERLDEGRLDLPTLANKYLRQRGRAAPTATVSEHDNEHADDQVVAAYVIAGLKADSNPLSYACTLLDERFEPKTTGHDDDERDDFESNAERIFAAAQRGAESA